MTQKTRNASIVDEWIGFKDSMEKEVYAFGRAAFDALTQGRTLTVAEASEAVGISNERGREIVGQLVQWGLMTEKDGVIDGAYGLTTRRTEYVLELAGRKLHTWCALDAVGIPAGLGVDAAVKAPARDGSGEVTVSIRGGNLQEGSKGVLVALPDPKMDANVRKEVCPEIAFYGPDGAPGHQDVGLLSLEEAMEAGRRMWGKSDAGPAACC